MFKIVVPSLENLSVILYILIVFFVFYEFSVFLYNGTNISEHKTSFNMTILEEKSIL